ncbi:baseplate J/gp47 family protein [Lentilactobacillus senioris]|uniref:baseplate J/gp47 family protein n=1 Tax=Lentilactobacillus senioris TaxID=931534 RepID=UPI00228283D6|nr:baseplate J/gp47 family protein [Lentilactobacillus senioris]MCY9807450.1 baseplate J/gp47 family protein [Lentilactobacillus senioris]
MTPEEIANDLATRDFEYYMDLMLEKVPDNIDTRQGSIIYDAMGPAAISLASSSLDLANVILQTYTQTSTSEFLDWRAAEKGTVRQPATFAQVKATFTDSEGNLINNVEMGDRFAGIGDDPIFYTVDSINNDGTAILNSEESGSRPNGYLGQILPVTPNDSLSWAEIIEISVPARDVEDDDHLRERLLAPESYIAYGGNIADYLDMLTKIDTVGAGQVYPTWQGGGTVKLVILDNDLLPASKTLVENVQTIIDPPDEPGMGYGLAPIDHVVTVIAPESFLVNIQSTIELDPNFTLDQVTINIKNGIESYFAKQRERWNDVNSQTGRGYSLSIYRSQVLAEIMKVDGVLNASLPLLNDSESDINMTFNNEVSQLPIMGEVLLNG